MIGQKIRENRLRLKMTQEVLADKVSVTKTSISKWELNQSCPDITFLPLLADIFDITIDELMDYQKCGQTHEKIHYRATLIEDQLKNAGILPYGTIENHSSHPNFPSVRLCQGCDENGEWRSEIHIDFNFTKPDVLQKIQRTLSKDEYRDIIEVHSINGQDTEIYHLWVCHDEILRFRIGDRAGNKMVKLKLIEKGIMDEDDLY